jgi:glycosyltransferase involved in cell wall biosynthesis
VNRERCDPAVSVLLPTWQALDTLPAAVESVLSQEGPALELVVVDDGSTDGTAGWLAALARRDPRVVPLVRPHGGLVAALNAGLRRCRAPLVARMDADDVSLPGRLAAQVAWLAAHPAAGLVGCLVRSIPDELVAGGMRAYEAWQNSLVEHEDIVREIFVEAPLVHPSVVVRRPVLEAVGGFRDRGWPEDYDLWLRLYAAGVRFGKVPAVLLHWRERPTRLTRSHPAYAAERHLALKAHFLPRTVLAGRPLVQIWGAGRGGKLLRRALAAEGVAVARFFDIDPKKVGGAVERRVPVLPHTALAAHRDLPTLVAVGARGARAQIRAALPALGAVEGRDLWFTA